MTTPPAPPRGDPEPAAGAEPFPTFLPPSDEELVGSPDAGDDGGDGGDGGDDDKSKRKAKRGPVVELLIMLGITLLVIVVVRAFLIQTFFIPSASMETTLVCNDRVLVWRPAYWFHGPSRGDVVVFRSWTGDNGSITTDVPSESFLGSVGRSLREAAWLEDRPDDIIKRVIATPGETVEVRDSQAYVNGKKLDEPYVFLTGPDSTADFGPVTVPPGHYFMMGDHRNDSADSRQSDNGLFLDEDLIIGKAFVRFWPLNRLGGLGGPPDRDEDPELCEGRGG